MPYPDAATIQQASYVDVLRGRIDPRMLRGKWILVGATAHGLGERVLTPGHAGEVRIPGVLYQASLASMLLRGDAITPASAGAIAAGQIGAGDRIICLGAGDITKWAAGLADAVGKRRTA